MDHSETTAFRNYELDFLGFSFGKSGKICEGNIANSKISNTKDMYLVLFDITHCIFLVRHHELYFREFNFATWTCEYDNYMYVFR